MNWEFVETTPANGTMYRSLVGDMLKVAYSNSVRLYFNSCSQLVPTFPAHFRECIIFYNDTGKIEYIKNT